MSEYADFFKIVGLFQLPGTYNYTLLSSSQMSTIISFMEARRRVE
jgi:hypothetical protein